MEVLKITGNVLLKDICRLWQYIKKRKEDECWEWTGAINIGRNGNLSYGLLRMVGKNYKPHRIIYYLTYNIDPLELEVCHSCNNTICCNPNHLYLGTHQENIEHATRDGLMTGPFSSQTGENHNNVKLTKIDIEEIRLKRKQGWKLRELADEYHVARQHIGLVCNGQRWKN